MENPITTENVFEVDVQKLALDSRFGSLVFEEASKKLSKAQKWLKEAHDLKYTELLLPTGIGQIDTLINQLVVHLEWLRVFDIGAVTNPKDEHDQFNSRIDNWYNGVFTQLSMGFLPFLREERRRENPDQNQFDKEVTKIIQIRTDLEKELKNTLEETQKIRTTNKEVGSAKGVHAAVQLAKHFDGEVVRYEKNANLWFSAVVIGYTIVLVVLVSLGVATAAYMDKIFAVSKTASSTAAIFTGNNGIWGAIISKLVLFAALWYGLSFIIKNFNVNSHLAAINRHRAVAARTLEDFIAVEQQQEKPRLSEVLQNASEAMFENMPIGYVSKTEKENGNPVFQIVNDLIGIKK